MQAYLKRTGLMVCLVLSLMILLIQPAAAVECLSPSPSITQLKETPFAPLTIRDLTPAEHQMVSKLFRSLEGDWQGISAQFFCRSNTDPSDISTDRPTIRARVRVDRNSNLRLTAELYSQKDQTSYQKDLWLYLNNQRLRLNNDNGTGDVQLLTISETKIAFFTRVGISSSTSSGTTRQEPFYTITRTSDGFTIEVRIYVQGKLSSGHTWHLKKG